MPKLPLRIVDPSLICGFVGPHKSISQTAFFWGGAHGKTNTQIYRQTGTQTTVHSSMATSALCRRCC